MAREINQWWGNYPDEIYWFETTDRDDIGADLNAPAEKGAAGTIGATTSFKKFVPAT